MSNDDICIGDVPSTVARAFGQDHIASWLYREEDRLYGRKKKEVHHSQDENEDKEQKEQEQQS